MTDPRKPSDLEHRGESDPRRPATEQPAERSAKFTTVSGHPIRRLYTPEDLSEWEPHRDLGLPGEPDLCHPRLRSFSTMYRSRLWTMRQFAGFGSAEDTNQRFQFLLSQGQTGLSVAFDLPTLMGYDSDDALADGEVGKCGVAISSLADMEILFDKIPLGSVSTSMTINSPAAILWAMYLAVAERQGVDWKLLNGTLQNDILKEYIAQKEYIYPPKPSMRLVTDSIEFGARHTPRFNPISISGYHIREAGSTAIQELAFTLRDAIEYVEWSIARGLLVDDFAPRLSFFFDVHNDFFEEIAKLRAGRRIWYQVMTERFGAKSPRSWALRFHAQTAGCSLTAQQPYNNVVRTALQALAAVMGGAQFLHTNSWTKRGRCQPNSPRPSRCAPADHRSRKRDQYRGLARRLLLRREVTEEVEHGARDYIGKIDAMGGMVAAIEQAYPQREIRTQILPLPDGGRPQGKDYRGRERVH